jgi:hypothetical protein
VARTSAVGLCLFDTSCADFIVSNFFDLEKKCRCDASEQWGAASAAPSFYARPPINRIVITTTKKMTMATTAALSPGAMKYSGISDNPMAFKCQQLLFASVSWPIATVQGGGKRRRYFLWVPRHVSPVQHRAASKIAKTPGTTRRKYEKRNGVR